MGATAVEPRIRATQRAGWGVVEALVGVLLALVLMFLLVRWLTSGVYYDGNLALVLSYAVVWVPLLGACAYACFVRGSRSLVRDFGLRFTLLDVLFGVGFGLIARVIASIVEIAAYGRMASLGVTFGDIVYDGWWVFGTIIAPVLIAPFVEELFFRGLVLRASYRATLRAGASDRSGVADAESAADAVAATSAVGATSAATATNASDAATATGAASRARTATVVSIIVSAALFTLLHVAEAANPTAALVLGISTLVLGLGNALIASLTGRLGGAIIAHVTFNASLVLAALTL